LLVSGQAYLFKNVLRKAKNLKLNITDVWRLYNWTERLLLILLVAIINNANSCLLHTQSLFIPRCFITMQRAGSRELHLTNYFYDRARPLHKKAFIQTYVNKMA
jgi:hypothetical protein